MARTREPAGHRDLGYGQFCLSQQQLRTVELYATVVRTQTRAKVESEQPIQLSNGDSNFSG
jgi:hypothetical protein